MLCKGVLYQDPGQEEVIGDPQKWVAGCMILMDSGLRIGGTDLHNLKGPLETALMFTDTPVKPSLMICCVLSSDQAVGPEEQEVYKAVRRSRE